MLCLWLLSFLALEMQPGVWHVFICEEPEEGCQYTKRSMVQCKRGTFDDAGVSPYLLTTGLYALQNML